MKTALNYTVVAALLTVNISAGIANAAPVGASNESVEYLLAAKDLSRFSAGIYVDVIERDVEWNRRPEISMKTERAMACIGYQPFREWLEIYGALGLAQYRMGNNSDYGDKETEWALGLKLNLLDHDIMDPVLMEDRVRINAILQVSGVDADIEGDSYDWLEFYGALTFGLVNDCMGNKLYVPQSIAAFAGPIYSSINGDDIEETDSFGGTAGLTFQFTRKVSLDLAVEYINDPSLTSALFVRF